MKTTITIAGSLVSVEVDSGHRVPDMGYEAPWRPPSFRFEKAPQPDTWKALSEMGLRAYEAIQKKEEARRLDIGDWLAPKEWVVLLKHDHKEWMVRALRDCQSEAGCLGPKSELVKCAERILGTSSVSFDAKSMDTLEFVHEVELGRFETWTFEWIGHVWQLKTYKMDSIQNTHAREDEDEDWKWEEAKDIPGTLERTAETFTVGLSEFNEAEALRNPPVDMQGSCALVDVARGVLPRKVQEGDILVFVDTRLMVEGMVPYDPIAYMYNETTKVWSRSKLPQEESESYGGTAV